MKERSVIPEILDELSSDDPRAIRSRRDLRFINSLMGNYRWIRYRVRHTQLYEPHAWVEVGAGDGKLCDVLPRGFPVSGIDFAPRPEKWRDGWDWHQGDVFDNLRTLRKTRLPDGLIANLFLHHFDFAALAELGQIIDQRFSRIIVSEPARYPIFRTLGYALFPFVNDVTRHDTLVSIDAGFRPGELGVALGLSPSWKCRESVTALGAYRFEAWKE